MISEKQRELEVAILTIQPQYQTVHISKVLFVSLEGEALKKRKGLSGKK